MTNLPAGHTQRVSDFLTKVKTSKRGRLLFIVDATGSRERAWDMASKLQADMFNAAAGIVTLDVQLVYFRGMVGFDGECKASRWTNDARYLSDRTDPDSTRARTCPQGAPGPADQRDRLYRRHV